MTYSLPSLSLTALGSALVAPDRRPAILLDVFAALLADPHVLAPVVAAVTDASRLVAGGANQHDVGAVNVPGAGDDPALAHTLILPHRPLDDVHALHQQTTFFG